MSYFRLGDPLDDFDRLEREREEFEATLPVCDYCDEHIHEEHYYEINGEKLCQKCLDDHFRRTVEGC